MALGRRSTLLMSLTLTPVTLSSSEREKKPIAKVPASRGCSSGVNNERRRSAKPGFAAAALLTAKSRSDVAARMLCNRFAGGSTSASDCNQVKPDFASANSGPQTPHTSEWERKRSACSPVSLPSTASIRRASNSLHGIPDWVLSTITSPAYKYAVRGEKVPLDPG